MNPTLRTVLRMVGAAALLLDGLLHLKVWNRDYKDLESGVVPGVFVVNPGFLIYTAVALGLAIVLLLVKERPMVWAAGMLFSLGSVLAIVLSRQASLFGWEEPVWNLDAKVALGLGVVGAASLLVLLVMDFLHTEHENELFAL